MRILFLAFLLTLSACSSVGWVIHHNPPISDLMISDEEVAEVIAELSVEPTDKDAVVYNPATDRYEIRPDAYAKAVKDGVMWKIAKKKMVEFAEDYKPETFGDAVKKDLGTTGFIILILSIAGILAL